uniref:Uncharacterized protein n=1 Tax=Gallid alphaherpesvirus 2 TaxID=10390 RepID=Q159H4_9ALPH|nr:hypothetical protein MDV075.45 [Gallid alphaherpesvirus 2]ABG22663.1 hypothetical protein MDV075.45 [Gallid alphaherpesvirus 2]ABG22694.1 hypothetical protein MDV075.45 [Gallid alphaherpesvirus 2]ABG22725.1 hypothetical protein MDV075.45 [Gallid alphaherpesvirus 2]ABG22756.1 hypothetical protein MDV075.45 [Gallid alphaherpesvirus 2]
MEGYMSFSAEIGSGGRGMFHETVDLSHHRQLLPRGFAPCLQRLLQSI